jgi:putative inorganic carbon (hco3(-)) transporter
VVLTAIVVQQERLRKSLVITAAIVASAGIGVASSLHPRQAALAAAAAALLVVLCVESTIALYLLVASFYFDSYLSRGGGYVTAGKLLGLVVVVAWLLEWIRHDRRFASAPQLPWLGALILVVVVSTVAASSTSAALSVGSRYVMFAAIFVIVFQSARLPDIGRGMASATVIAATIASCIGLVNFALQRDRASGPLAGADDLGFLLASTMPAAIWWARRRRTRIGWISYIPALLIGACVLATLSRGAVLALAVTAIWALASGRARIPRLSGRAVILLAVLLGFLVTTSVVGAALQRKQVMADANVTQRLYLWRVAVREFRANPLIGVGPGNYTVRFPDYASPFTAQEVQTTHNAYLNVLAELGICGGLVFLGYLVSCWRTITTRRSVEDPGLMTAAVAGFLIALVGACFLTEQFYAPLWFWPALATGLLLRPAGHDVSA